MNKILLIYFVLFCSGFVATAQVPSISSFSPTTATIGYTVVIKGSGFTGATAVSFGEVAAASFAVEDDATINAILGTGTSGVVSVTTPNGNATLAGFSYCTGVMPSVSMTASVVSIAPNTTVTFTASSTNGGRAPAFQWYKNEILLTGANLNTYTTSTLTNNDSVWVVLNSNAACTIVNNVISNKISMYVSNAIITSVAGNGTNGWSGDGGQATLANLSEPYSVAVDASGNLYIAEKSNNDIRKVTANGIISTLVGNGNPVYGGDGGAAVSSSLKAPTAVALDKIGNLYIADYGNNRVRKVDINGIITTIAGNGTAAYAGDGGLATAASINGPISLAIDATGNIYIAEYNTSVIRMVNNKGIITTVAGSGSWGDGGDGGLATAAQLFWPSGVAIDVSGNLYIADTRYGYIRKVNTNGIISRVVGKSIDYTFGNGNGDGGLATSANIYGATGITVDVAGNLFIADSRNNRIRIVGKNGIINTIAGNGGNPDGYAAVLAGVSSPNSTTIDLLGNLYIADVGNNRVRKIANVAFVPTTSPTISSFTPKIATNETIVTIKGIAFTGTSSVTFGGMSAYSFNVVNDSVITAIIATGTSGNVSVSNAIGSSILSGFIYYDKPVTKEISLVGCDSIIYNGKIYQLSIAKTDTLKNYLGYDSIYNKATLSVNQSPILSISGGTVPRSDNTILTAIVNNRVNTSTYRYIKFTSTYSADNGQVNVYEIQAFKNGINVALNKPGYANSYEGGGSWNSNGKNVNDGSSSRWSSDRGNPGHANTTIPVFIVIDLQQVYTVDSVLLNIAGFDNHKQTFTLQVSTDSVSWSTIGSGTNITGIFTYQLTSNNFLWSTGATTQSITVNSSGIYSIKITDINGCLKTAFYTVNMALPLNITAFSANTINQNIKTEWQTASEQNTDYFIIQRSTDGISFTDIGTLKAIGSGANKYAFTDKNPNNGINYYRLQNVDKDGSFTYSKVVNANINDKKYFSISPNPASDFAIINFGKTVEKATLLVCDITGKVLITQTIPGNSNTYKLNIQTLTNGFYVIRVNTSTASFNEKLIIQK